MSILLTPSVTISEPRDFFAMQQTWLCSEKKSIDSQDCFFNLFNCDRPIPQFIDIIDPQDKFKNDFFSFIDIVQTGQTIDLEMEDVNSGVITAITALNVGTFRDLGAYSLAPKVWSFVFDWNKVHGLLGFGEYVFRATIKSALGSTIAVDTSPCFALMPFDCDDAHGTVRFETLQTGHIHNGFDYRGINFQTTTGLTATQVEGWKQQIRWYGTFIPIVPDEEDDFHQTSNRIEEQVQQKITEKYKLDLQYIRSEFGVQLTKDNFLADQILITDYNLSNYEFYRDRDVRKVSTDELDKFQMQKNITMSWTFKDRDEGTVKRRFG